MSTTLLASLIGAGGLVLATVITAGSGVFRDRLAQEKEHSNRLLSDVEKQNEAIARLATVFKEALDRLSESVSTGRSDTDAKLLDVSAKLADVATKLAVLLDRKSQ